MAGSISVRGIRSFSANQESQVTSRRSTSKLEDYEDYSLKMRGILKAELRCASDPTEEDLSRITDHVRKQYGTSEIRWRIVHDPSLIGGFVIRIGDRESDWSIRGRLAQLQQKLIWR